MWLRMKGIQNRLLTVRRSWRNLTFEDWWLALRGQISLLRAQLDLRRRPQGHLVRKQRDAGAVTAPNPDELPRARKVARGVTRAAAHGVFTPTCLVQSMAISGLLEAQGIRGGVVRVGVAKRNGKFVAHAWVEFGGVVIGDDASSVELYEPLDELQVTAPH